MADNYEDYDYDGEGEGDDYGVEEHEHDENCGDNCDEEGEEYQYDVLDLEKESSDVYIIDDVFNDD